MGWGCQQGNLMVLMLIHAVLFGDEALFYACCLALCSFYWTHSYIATWRTRRCPVAPLLGLSSNLHSYMCTTERLCNSILRIWSVYFSRFCKHALVGLKFCRIGRDAPALAQWCTSLSPNLRPRRIDSCICVPLEGLGEEQGGSRGGGSGKLKCAQLSGTAIFSLSSAYIWAQKWT